MSQQYQVSHQHQSLRTEAAQAFEASLHDLETQLMASEGPKQGYPSPTKKQPIPLKTAHRLPFHLSTSTSLCQQEFDLESLQDAAADIEQFIQGRHGANHRLA